jgi:hypothetical protein
MNTLLKDDEVHNAESPSVIVEDFNRLLTETITLGDNLLTLNIDLIRRSLFFASSILSGLSVLISSLTGFGQYMFYGYPTVGLLLGLGIMFWVTYSTLTFFAMRRVNSSALGAFRIPDFFIYVPATIRVDFTIFQKLLEITRTTGDSLYQSGLLSELRWQTVKLHLSRYGI